MAAPSAPRWLPEALDALERRVALWWTVVGVVVLGGAAAALVAPQIVAPRPLVGLLVGLAALLLASAATVAVDAGDPVLRGPRHVRAAGGELVGVLPDRPDPDAAGDLAAAILEARPGRRLTLGLGAAQPGSNTAAWAHALGTAIARRGTSVLLVDLAGGASPEDGILEVLRDGQPLGRTVALDPDLKLATIGAGRDLDAALREASRLPERLPRDLEVLLVALPPIAAGDVLAVATALDAVLVLGATDRTRRARLQAAVEAVEAGGTAAQVVLIDPRLAGGTTPATTPATAGGADTHAADSTGTDAAGGASAGAPESALTASASTRMASADAAGAAGADDRRADGPEPEPAAHRDDSSGPAGSAPPSTGVAGSGGALGPRPRGLSAVPDPVEVADARLEADRGDAPTSQDRPDPSGRYEDVPPPSNWRAAAGVPSDPPTSSVGEDAPRSRGEEHEPDGDRTDGAPDVSPTASVSPSSTSTDGPGAPTSPADEEGSPERPVDLGARPRPSVRLVRGVEPSPRRPLRPESPVPRVHPTVASPQDPAEGEEADAPELADPEATRAEPAGPGSADSEPAADEPAGPGPAGAEGTPDPERTEPAGQESEVPTGPSDPSADAEPAPLAADAEPAPLAADAEPAPLAADAAQTAPADDAASGAPAADAAPTPSAVEAEPAPPAADAGLTSPGLGRDASTPVADVEMDLDLDPTSASAEAPPEADRDEDLPDADADDAGPARTRTPLRDALATARSAEMLRELRGATAADRFAPTVAPEPDDEAPAEAAAAAPEPAVSEQIASEPVVAQPATPEPGASESIVAEPVVPEPNDDVASPAEADAGPEAAEDIEPFEGVDTARIETHTDEGLPRTLRGDEADDPLRTTAQLALLLDQLEDRESPPS